MRRPPHHPARLAAPQARLDGIGRLGALLVLALVAALPLMLAFCPASALDGGASGAGTGDVVAAALTSLDRDLHGTRALPAPARSDATVLAATPWHPKLPPMPTSCAVAPPCEGAFADRPGEVLAGPHGLGHPLLS